MIGDDEIEQLLYEYASPILYAAGLSHQNIRIYIVNDLSFNAVVINGRGIFIHAGALMESETPIEVRGVIAHEAGHISGAHLAALRSVSNNTKTMALLCRALGIAAAATGVLAGESNVGSAGFGIGMGCENIAYMNLLAYKRPVEAAADKAGVEFLNRAGLSVCGMVKTLEHLTDKQRGLKQEISIYRQTHPYAVNRLAQVRNDVSEDCRLYRDVPELQLRHDFMRAKLYGYLYEHNPDLILTRQYPPSDQSYAAQYARAIAFYFRDGVDAFLPKIDALIKAFPNNPYFYELKGELLFRDGRMRQSIVPLREAIKAHELLASRSKKRKSRNLRVLLGRALVASDAQKHALEAIPLLQRGLSANKSNYLLHHDIGRAYAAVGRIDDSDLSHAKYLYYRPMDNSVDKRMDLDRARQIAEEVNSRAGAGARAAADFLFRLPKTR